MLKIYYKSWRCLSKWYTNEIQCSSLLMSIQIPFYSKQFQTYSSESLYMWDPVKSTVVSVNTRTHTNMQYFEILDYKEEVLCTWNLYICSIISSVQLLSHVWLCDPMGYRPVHHQLLELTLTHIHRFYDAIHHPLLSPSPPALNLSQHQDLFKWVISSHQVAKVLEFQLKHQSFQWIFKTDFL